ncbi:serine arginine repetitive matrix protein 2 [Lasius niger]|uniref:Serine arginine repetitive matrix protein 2 n=1 Tax=Lasius niger TaxID=67767 RepID=A0A0J7NUG2_LASNI|nr:serine arginine repetitive matrix protein 2 [Lasius niger]
MKHEKNTAVDKATRNEISENLATSSREPPSRSTRSPKRADRTISRNETPPLPPSAPKSKKDSPTKKSTAEKRDKSPVGHNRSSPPSHKRHRSSSRSRGDRGDRGGRSPRRYSRSRRASPSPKRRWGYSRSPKRHSRYSVSRSRSRSRYDRYGSSRRRPASPPTRRREADSRRRSRSARRQQRRRSRSRSTLSYSPVRKNPERYRDILEDRKQRQDQKRKTKSNKKSRSTSRSRRTQQIAVAPRVSLRSSSEDEVDLVDDEQPGKQQQQQQQEEDEERSRIMELNTLKRLQSGLAAKARETLEKKVITPVKIKIERREDSVLDIALPNEPPKTIAPIRDRSEEPVQQALPIIQSPVSSRSPSPALPLTREEAAIKIRSPSESPPPLPLPQQSSGEKVDSAPLPGGVKIKMNRRLSRSPSFSGKKDLTPIASSRKEPDEEIVAQSKNETLIPLEIFLNGIEAHERVEVALQMQEIGFAIQKQKSIVVKEKIAQPLVSVEELQKQIAVAEKVTQPFAIQEVQESLAIGVENIQGQGETQPYEEQFAFFRSLETQSKQKLLQLVEIVEQRLQSILPFQLEQFRLH